MAYSPAGGARSDVLVEADKTEMAMAAVDAANATENTQPIQAPTVKLRIGQEHRGVSADSALGIAGASMPFWCA